MVDSRGSNAVTNASTLYQFLKCLEPLSTRQPISLKQSSIRIDQVMMKTLSGKIPRYATTTISHSYKCNAANAKRKKSEFEINKTSSHLLMKTKPEPHFYSVFKPPGSSGNELSNGNAMKESLTKLFQKEVKSPTCEYSIGYASAEFSKSFGNSHLLHEYNKDLMDLLKSKKRINREILKVIKEALLKNEKCNEELEMKCSKLKETQKVLQSTLYRIQSLCSLYY